MVDSKHENYECVQNVVNSQMYVSEYALHGYPITEADILTTGSQAWDSSLNTINVGKYNLDLPNIKVFKEQIALLVELLMIKKPTVNPERFNRIWEKDVFMLKGAYRMND